MPIGSIERLHHHLDGKPLLKNLDTRFYPGETIGLVGPPGAGKSQLLALLLGLGFPSEGEVLLWGERSTDLKPRRRQRLGLAPQRDELMPLLSGRDHLQLYRALRSTHWDQALVEKLTQAWALPLHLAAHKMTLAQRQQLTLLLAAAHRPDLLVLDEPLASLAPEDRAEILDTLLKALNSEQRTVIIASRQVELIEPLSQRVWLLHEGKLAWDSDPQGLKMALTEGELSPAIAQTLGIDPPQAQN